MNLDTNTGKFISSALSDNAARPMLTHAEISQKNIPGLPLDDGQGVVAATDGFRLHISTVILNGAMGVVGLAKAGKEYVTIPPSADTEGLRYPDYCVAIPVRNLTTAPLEDWPTTISETTAKGLAKANVWATFKAADNVMRFTGFHAAPGHSLISETTFGAVLLNPLHVRQAVAGMGNGTLYMAFDADRTGMRPVKIFSDNGNLAVVMAGQPPK